MDRFYVERNGDFYAVLDSEEREPSQPDQNRLVINGNLWEAAVADAEERRVTLEEWILEHHAPEIEDYLRTGETVWDRYNQSLADGSAKR